MTKRILVVDDDKLILMTLKRLLIREGYQVTTALSGQWALKKVEDDGFDLVISDIKMPEMDGIETVRKIREFLTQHGKNQVPEIFITAYAKEDVYQEALALNAAGYIEKPFDVKTLVETVSKVIEGRSPNKFRFN